MAKLGHPFFGAESIPFFLHFPGDGTAVDEERIGGQQFGQCQLGWF